MADPFRILIVGYGEIARQAHAPVLQSRRDSLVIGLVDPTFSEKEVVAVTTNDASIPATKSSSNPLKFTSVSDAFKYFQSSINAVSICTPKTATLAVAWEVLRIASSNDGSKLRGILLEKPPGDDVDELKRIIDYGKKRGISMFTACHTAMCPARKVIDSWLFTEAVTEAERNIKSKVNNEICRRSLDSIRIIWKENVRKWHPGQTWISKESGGGVTDMLFNPISLIVSLFGLSFTSMATTNHDKDSSAQTIDPERSIRLVKASLVQPRNWEAPVSGHAELLVTVRLSDGSDGNECTSEMKVPILADFAFDYMPTSEDPDDEEIWNIEFAESVQNSDKGSSCTILTLKDGGAQAYIGSQKGTTEPTAEYPLRPEYEALYEHFLDLLQENRSNRVGEAPSDVDCTTLAVLKEIVRLGHYTSGPRFDF